MAGHACPCGPVLDTGFGGRDFTSCGLGSTWVAAEVAIFGYSNEPPLQAIYGILGVAMVIVALRWLQVVGLPDMTGMHGRPSTHAGANT